MDRLPIFTLLLFLLSLLHLSEGGSIGINYGRIADNLPPATQVVKLVKSQGIDRVKIYDSDTAVLKAFANTQIKLTINLPNEQLKDAATRPSYAPVWVRRNVVAYYPKTLIETIAVGNEVFVDPNNTTRYLVDAMRNVHNALVKYGLDSKIKVSSPIALSALGNSYPCSAGAFRPELVNPVVLPMLQLLRQTGSPLMVNAYPIFAYQGNSDVISLDYALFRPNPGVVDSGNGNRYFNLLDAQIDAVFAAMSALKYDDIPVIVSETGWPSKGDAMELGASVENAAAYNGNLVKRILTGGGTPLRPKADLTVFLFALFNENQKPGPTSEKNYGLFYPTESKVYNIPLTLQGLKTWKDNVKGGSTSGGGGGAARAKPAPVAAPVVRGRPKAGGKVTVKETWCVANGQVGQDQLQKALDYACGEGGADCHPIQPGSPCFDPDTLEAHASYAFNSFYQKNNRAMGSCDFQGSAFVVSQPPRYGTCEFPTRY